MSRFWVLLLLVAGCAKGGPVGGDRASCVTDDDCNARCVDGACTPYEADVEIDGADDAVADTAGDAAADGGDLDVGEELQDLAEADARAGCNDPDGDWYGVGPTCLGADCDEENPEIHGGALEVCDGLDNDCDGVVDEETALDRDTLNCGGCGNECTAPTQRLVACVDGGCVVGECAEGYQDLDGEADNGCEHGCTPSNGGVEVCDGEDNDCDGIPDDGVSNRCGGCGPEPTEVCDGEDNDCDEDVDEDRVCGTWIQSRCRLFVGWADKGRGPGGASPTWGVCPAGDRGQTGDVRCVGTRRDGRFARLQLPGDVNDDDEVGTSLLCDDPGNPPLAGYVQSHCTLYLGHADNRRGVDNSPTWGDCPPAASGDDGRLRCTSGGFDGRFRAIRLSGDVDDNDQIGVAWICRDDNDPDRARALQASAEVFVGWADNNRGPADGSATWGPCPSQPGGDANNQRCTSTRGDGLYHLMLLGGDVDDNDQMGWALRSR